jgi:hypothetical protein
VESIVDTLTANQLTINANDNPNFVRITDGPTVNGVQTTKVRIFNLVSENDNGSDEDHGHGDDKANGDDKGKGDDKGQGGDNGQGDNNSQGDDNGQGDDDHGEDDHGAEATKFPPITFANKTNVTINGMGGDDVFVLNNSHPAAGLTQLTLDGGTGQNTLIERNVPPGVTLTTTNFQTIITNTEDSEVDELFEEDLGRLAGPSELAAWDANLHTMGVAGVATSIESSWEARTLFVKRLYSQYLGRSAQGGEEQGWVNDLMHGATEESITAGLMGSAEFQARAQSMASSGSGDTATIQGLYTILLGRSAGSGEAAGWVGALQTEGLGAIASQFLQSAEFRGTAVDTSYQYLLGRTADPSGLAGWVNSSMDMHSIRRGIESSPEFAQDT